mmetsp:Transcript_13002/g.17123  ORF Transcript_13002/g.17123 Transcript_13002/m.17123 type:complete len:100 (+) Transcript_13002:1-300(+)
MRGGATLPVQATASPIPQPELSGNGSTFKRAQPGQSSLCQVLLDVDSCSFTIADNSSEGLIVLDHSVFVEDAQEEKPLKLRRKASPRVAVYHITQSQLS